MDTDQWLSLTSVLLVGVLCVACVVIGARRPEDDDPLTEILTDAIPSHR